MRYRFIDAHKKAWPVNLMCGVLEVSRSGYYHWTKRGPSLCTRSNRKLDRRIREIFARHRQCYGIPRITDELHDEGIECSENRVARRMRALGLSDIGYRCYSSKQLKSVSRIMGEDQPGESRHYLGALMSR